MSDVAQQQAETQQPVTQEPAPQKEAGFFVPSKDEWVDFRREVRQLKESIKGGSAAAPESAKQPSTSANNDVATLAATVARLESERAFERAVNRSGLQFSVDQLGILESTFAHQKPAPEHLSDWMQRTASAMGVRPAGQQATTNVVPDPPKNKATDNNTGTPQRSPDGTAKDPRVFAADNPTAWARLPDGERKKWLDDWERQNGNGAGALQAAHVLRRQ
jgi:hypothetical protein